jgi:hypothetical protein
MAQDGGLRFDLVDAFVLVLKSKENRENPRPCRIVTVSESNIRLSQSPGGQSTIHVGSRSSVLVSREILITDLS